MKMKPQTTTTLLAALVLLSIFWFGASDSARAQDPPHRIDLKSSSLYGLANFQIARLNVVNLGDRENQSAQVELLFLDSTGAILASSTQTIMPGRAVSFDFAFRALGTTGGRLQLRSVVRGAAPFKTIRNLKMSVEVFDEDTGKTAVFVDNFSSGEAVL